MKSFKMKIWAILLILSVSLLHFACSQKQDVSTVTNSPADYKDVVENLSELVKSTPDLKAQIGQALKMQNRKSYWHQKTSDDFVKFFKEWLVYNPLPEAPGKHIRIFDALVNSGAGEILFNNNVFSSWFISFLDGRGQYLNTKESSKALDKWMAYPATKIEDYVVPPGGFKNFGDFFLRKLKPGVSPLAGKNNPSVLVSPADGSLRQIYVEDLDANFKVKRDVINMRQVLNNSPYADKFIGGKIVDLLLWFTDYHHFHAPVTGKIVDYGEYPGSYNYNFEKINWYKQLAKHKRLFYIYQTEEFGLVAMIPVGFWGVGSIRSICSKGDSVKKGEEVGHFEYGGSSIILVFEPNAVEFTIPVKDKEVPVRVRQQIGVATKKNEG